MKSKVGFMGDKRFVSLIIVTFILLLVYAYDASYEKNITSLKNSCGKLKLETGKDYNPIVGRFLASEHQRYWVSHSDDVLIFKMPVIINNSQKVTVLASVPTDDAIYMQQRLFEVFGETNIREKFDTNNIYGICAFRSKYIPDRPVYGGEFNTLTRLD